MATKPGSSSRSKAEQDLRNHARSVTITVMVVSSVVFAAFTAFFREPVLSVLDKVYGISSFMEEAALKRAGDRIDSGYSAVLRLADGARPTDQTLSFYAVEGQRVVITLIASSLGSLERDLNIVAKLDEQPFDTLTVPDQGIRKTSISTGNVLTRNLVFIGREVANVHDVSVHPADAGGMRPGEDVVIRAVVLVYSNDPEKGDAHAQN